MSYIPNANPLPVTGPLTDAELRASSVNIAIADCVNLDAFGRLRVSNPTSLYDSQQEYGLDTLRLWDAVCYDASGPSTVYSYTNPSPFGNVVNGSNLVGPRNANTRMTPITVSADSGDYSILQSRQYPRYNPAKSLLTFITGIFATGANSTAKLVVRTSTGGSASDSSYADQADWNIDKFDGTGASGITIDFTKTQILFIEAQWLGVGRVIAGFDINGNLYPAHQFILHANTLTVPYSQTFNLPVRLEARCSGANTIARIGQFDQGNGVFLETTRAVAGGSIQFICCSVQSEGGIEAKGFPHSVSNGITEISVTTRRPVLSIRPATLYNFITNRGHIELADALITARTNSSYFELVMGGTLTGASWLRKGQSITSGSFVVGLTYVILTVGTTDFTLIGAAANTVGLEFVATGVGIGTGTACLDVSMVEYDISATTISGGVVIGNGYAIAGAGAARGDSISGAPDIRGPLTLSQIDSLTPMQGNLSIVCTSFTGTSSISSALHWHEQVV